MNIHNLKAGDRIQEKGYKREIKVDSVEEKVEIDTLQKILKQLK